MPIAARKQIILIAGATTLQALTVNSITRKRKYLSADLSISAPACICPAKRFSAASSIQLTVGLQYVGYGSLFELTEHLTYSKIEMERVDHRLLLRPEQEMAKLFMGFAFLRQTRPRAFFCIPAD